MAPHQKAMVALAQHAERRDITIPGNEQKTAGLKHQLTVEQTTQLTGERLAALRLDRGRRLLSQLLRFAAL